MTSESRDPQGSETSESVEHRPLTQAHVPDGLVRLIGDDSAHPEEPAPGERKARSEPTPSNIDWESFADSLVRSAIEQNSALSKSRALTVAGVLFSELGHSHQAEDCLTEATEVSPRLAVSAMLHRKYTEDKSKASVRHSSESSMRQASQEDSRTHAARALLGILYQSGQRQEYGTLLDHVARNRPDDRTLVLHRLAHRIAEKQSLAGVELPTALRDPVLFSQELLAGREAAGSHFSPSRDFPHKKPLFLLRAARLLDKGEYADAVAMLRSAGLEEDALSELEAALWTTKVGQRKKSNDILKALIQKSPSRTILRSLAFGAAAADDRELLSWVLQRADPGAGTFVLQERALLAALAGQEMRLDSDERSALAESELALSLSLGSATEAAPLLDRASEDALQVQLGANVKSYATRDESSRNLADQAVEELERRGSRSCLVAAYGLGQALLAQPGPSTVERLRGFFEAAGQERGELVLSLLSERILGIEDAIAVYRSAVALEPKFCEAKLRAERRLDQNSGRDDLKRLHEQTQSPWLRFEYALELLAFERRSAPGSSISSFEFPLLLSACEDLLRDLEPNNEGDAESESAASFPKNLDALLFSASCLAEVLGEQFLSDAFRQLLFPLPSPYSRFIWFAQRLKRAAVDGAKEGRGAPSDREQLAAYARSQDFGERVVSRMLMGAPEANDGPGAPIEKLTALLDRILRGTVAAPELSSTSTVELLAKTEAPWRSDWLRALLDDVQESLGDVEGLASRFLAQTKDGTNSEERRFALQRLADLDDRRGDTAGVAMWQKALCEEFPNYLPGLFQLEELRMREGDLKKTAALRERIAAELPPADRRSYLLFFGAEALARSDLRTARKKLEPLLYEEAPPLLALRALKVVANEKRDDELAAQVDEQLFDRAATDLDKSASALSVAYCRSRLGKAEEALDFAQKALESKPGSFAAAHLITALSPATDPVVIAEEKEQFAASAFAPNHRAELWLEAANAWSSAADPVREGACLEATLAAQKDHQEAFERLLELRRASRDVAGQRTLLIDRLSRLDASSREFLDLTLELSELLIKTDRPREAKDHLEKALIHHPKSAQALRVHADISAKLGEHESAERSLVALRDRLPQGDDRTAVLRSLARLYSDELEQWERAMDAFQAVLQASPKDPEARERLVDIYARLGLGERAASLQTEIIVDCKVSDEKRAGALKLARLYETVCRDEKRAVATLERTRKAWPLDADVLEASIRFMDRHGGGPRGFILDRAAKDARRTLEEGRLNAALLDTLARVALLSDAPGQSHACLVARSAYLGEPHEPLRPAGLSCLDEKIEDLLAPQGLARPLRNLFRKTGAAMDLAFAVDLSAFGARRLSPEQKDEVELDERVQSISGALSQGPVEIFLSEGLGARCLPVTARPARLLVGKSFLRLPGRPRDYLLLRAFKLQTMGVGALSRSRAEDRFAMVVALLQLFAPNWHVMGVEGRKVAQARALIEQGFARVGYDDDLPMLALETIGALGGQTSAPLGEASKRLASRAALIGVGDLSQCLEAIAAGEGKALPPGGPSRFRFMEAHPETRELILFATSSSFAQARAALGLQDERFSSPRHSAVPSGPSASSPSASSPLASGPSASSPLASRPSASELGARTSDVGTPARPAPPLRRPAPAPPRRPPSKIDD